MTQIDLLNDEILELVKERNETESRMQSATSTPEYNALQTKLAAINTEISAKQNQLEDSGTQDEINTAVYAALEGIPIAFILTTEKFELEQKIDIIARALSAEFEKAAEVTKSLRRDSEAREKLIGELREERDAAIIASADFETKLKNATEQLDEEKRSSKEKDEEIARLRESLSNAGARTSVATYEASKEEHIKALESRPPIFDLQWTDTLKKTHYTAKRADTGEQMEPFSRLTLGLYRVLEGEELERFREEYAAAEMDRLASQAHNVVVPDLQFPGEDAEVPEHTVDGTMDDAPVTRAEIRAIEERLSRLEQQTVRGAA